MAFVIKELKGKSVDFKNEIDFNKDFFKKNFKDVQSRDNVFLSSDHINSYFLLKEYRIGGLIVVDQHIDLWDLEGFNKSNVLRRCFEERLINFIVFVGTRRTEREVFEFEKDIHNIEIVKSKNFNEGVLEAIDILKEKKIKDIAIDIDLDVFDSNIIKGVEYSRDNLKNALDKRKEFIKKQLYEDGLDINVDVEKIRRYAMENHLNIRYLHITEFEPEFDDGETLNLIKELIR